MKSIAQAVIDYSQETSSGALLITGEWGIGKTYFIEKVVFGNLKSIGKRPIRISLFGEESLDSISKKTLVATFKYNKVKTEKSRKLWKFSNASSQGTSETITDFKIPTGFGVDIPLGQIVSNVGNYMLKTQNLEDYVIFFDDFERASEKVSPKDFLGFVNDFTENHNCRVVIVCNLDIFDNLEFVEKSIQKIIRFDTDPSRTFEILIEKYKDLDKDFFIKLNNQKSIITRSLEGKNSSLSFDKNITRSLKNLRTLNFAVQHYYKIYNATKKLDLDEKLSKNNFDNIWIYILAISTLYKINPVEFLKKNESLEDVEPFSFLDGINLDKIGFVETIKQNQQKENGGDIKTEDDRSALEIIKENFHERLNHKYHQLNEVYEFVIHGRPLKESDLSLELHNNFLTKDGNTNPAQELLDTLMQKTYHFSDEQYVDSLAKLYKHFKSGDFDSISSYLDATNRLVKYGKLIDVIPDQIIDIALKQIANLADVNWFDTSFAIEEKLGIFSTDKLRAFKTKLIDLVNKKKLEHQENLKKRFLYAFNENMDSLHDLFIETDQFQLGPKLALFELISEKEIKEMLEKISPKEIQTLNDIIRTRFIKQVVTSNVRNEVLFLKRLIEQIILLEEKTYTQILIKGEFLKELQKTYTDVTNSHPPSLPSN